MDYRSVNDSTEFEIEADKTIAVGANEADKTALMRALQTVNPPDGEDSALNALRDYPRARYTDIPSGKVDPSEIRVATAEFSLEPDDLAELHAVDPDVFANAKTWQLIRYLDNRKTWSLPGVPSSRCLADIEKDLTRFKAHLAKQESGADHVQALGEILNGLPRTRPLTGKLAANLDAWLEAALPLMDEDDEKAEKLFDQIRKTVRWADVHAKAATLIPRTPVFVYFSSTSPFGPGSTSRTWLSGRHPARSTTTTTSAMCAYWICSASQPRSCLTWLRCQHRRYHPTSTIRTRWSSISSR